MLIYSGCDLEHWREEFTRKRLWTSVFYIIINQVLKQLKKISYDKRPLLGAPAWFKGVKLTKPTK
jgi:hypothetical protein